MLYSAGGGPIRLRGWRWFRLLGGKAQTDSGAKPVAMSSGATDRVSRLEHGRFEERVCRSGARGARDHLPLQQAVARRSEATILSESTGFDSVRRPNSLVARILSLVVIRTGRHQTANGALRPAADVE